MKRAAVFFDRDGVLIEDVHLLTSKDQVKLCQGVLQVMILLRRQGFLLFVVTNQTVIARGEATVKEVEEINCYIDRLLVVEERRQIEKFYYCPHHPEATLDEYRQECSCRKPSPGMILAAAEEYDLDLEGSFMLGDRMSDIVAGSKAGCKTILIHSDKTLSSAIISSHMDYSVQADYECFGLLEAAVYIEKNKRNVQ
jgi:D-glycero-D-manno-heptose 1,7-bisphosphate phosphatase